MGTSPHNLIQVHITLLVFFKRTLVVGKRNWAQWVGVYSGGGHMKRKALFFLVQHSLAVLFSTVLILTQVGEQSALLLDERINSNVAFSCIIQNNVNKITSWLPPFRY